MSSSAHSAPANANAPVTSSRSLSPAAKADRSAAATGISDQTAARRYRRLAMLWLSVEPARLAEAGQAIAAHPEIPFAAATTGPTNLVASAVFRDTRHLYEYLTGDLAGLPGVSSVQTAPIIRTLKRTGSVR